MTYDTTILVKLDKRTKERMLRMNINWSEAIRVFIKGKMQREARIQNAERLRKLVFKKYAGPESTEIIRKSRDERYGAGSN